MTAPLLRARNLTKRFGGLTAVKDVTFEVSAGEIIGLIGPNGAGKTTLFSLLAGMHQPTSGEVLLDGRPITGMRPHQTCRLGLARTFQVVRPLQRMTVLENTMVGSFLLNADRREAEERALAVLELTGLHGKRFIEARSLTLPDRKRLEVARALATRPRVLLLDEVAAGLTPEESRRAADLILQIRETGVTIIAVEHVLKLIMNVSDRVIVLHHGELIAQGTPEAVVHNPAVIEAYLGVAYAEA